MTLSLGFSPCPNDCFIFDAIVHRRIDLEGLEFDVVLDDVEDAQPSGLAAATSTSPSSVFTRSRTVPTSSCCSTPAARSGAAAVRC